VEELLAITGAGFSESYGLLSTSDLTDAVRADDRGAFTWNYRYQPVPILQVLWKMAAGYYDSPNFETMLHLIEAMLSVRDSISGVAVPDGLRVAANSFMDLTPRWNGLVHCRELDEAPSLVIETLCRAIRAEPTGPCAAAR
jgi:hypothetical protein